ncbi:hypothetical protein KAR91_77405 [Candidatus Pacearchaeota archaeon]|nr:hypothetical protein [Candidatus Pacearchaeota archaeon]
MPSAVVSDWSDGPMGPGFLILFPRNRIVSYDGAPLPKIKKKDFSSRKEDTELVALMMLMREQC